MRISKTGVTELYTLAAPVLIIKYVSNYFAVMLICRVAALKTML